MWCLKIHYTIYLLLWWGQQIVNSLQLNMAQMKYVEATYNESKAHQTRSWSSVIWSTNTDIWIFILHFANSAIQNITWKDHQK